jgi:hypothetical protein
VIEEKKTTTRRKTNAARRNDELAAYKLAQLPFQACRRVLSNDRPTKNALEKNGRLDSGEASNPSDLQLSRKLSIE